MFYIFESSKTLVLVLGVHGSTQPVGQLAVAEAVS